VRADNDSADHDCLARSDVRLFSTVDERGFAGSSRERGAVAPFPPTRLNYRRAGRLKLPVYVGLCNEQGYPHQGVINFADNKVRSHHRQPFACGGNFDNSSARSSRAFTACAFRPASPATGPGWSSTEPSEQTRARKFVYVVDDKNIVQYRGVKPGRLEDDGLRVITDGLQPGDWGDRHRASAGPARQVR